jgi:hypothetical protein
MDRSQELKSWILHYEHEITILEAELAILEAEING